MFVQNVEISLSKSIKMEIRESSFNMKGGGVKIFRGGAKIFRHPKGGL